MKHVNLDALEEPLRQYVLALSVEPGGSILESGGQPVAWVVPAGSAPTGEEPWTETKNARRCDLIERKYQSALTPAEVVELAQLQEHMLRYRRRVAPLPLEDARKLHQELLNRAAQAPTGA